jgi:hypothetical protein
MAAAGAVSFAHDMSRRLLPPCIPATRAVTAPQWHGVPVNCYKDERSAPFRIARSEEQVVTGGKGRPYEHVSLVDETTNSSCSHPGLGNAVLCSQTRQIL